MHQPKSALQHSLPPRLVESVERLGRLVRARSFAHGLNPAQWEALRYLGRCNRFSNNPTALTAFLEATKGTVSQTLSALVRKGLVAKEPRPGQGRSLALILTDRARELLARDPLDCLHDAARRLDGEAEIMAHGLSRLIGDLQGRSGIPTFGDCHTCRHFAPRADGGTPHRCRHFGAGLQDAETDQICVAHEPGKPA